MQHVGPKIFEGGLYKSFVKLKSIIADQSVVKRTSNLFLICEIHVANNNLRLFHKYFIIGYHTVFSI